MDPLLKLLQENAAAKPGLLAKMLNLSEGEVTAKIKQYETDRIILGYRAILNEEKMGLDVVRALIEVKITPERGGGFDRVVEGDNLRDVARFVAEKLATIQGVISTATHFMLKVYKDHGMLVSEDSSEERLAVAP
jgi:DNA-binding Lrp family transcriptional regulator